MKTSYILAKDSTLNVSYERNCNLITPKTVILSSGFGRTFVTTVIKTPGFERSFVSTSIVLHRCAARTRLLHSLP